MLEIANRHITKPTAHGEDGLGLCDGQEFHIHDCYIDLQDNPLDELDEAMGLTWGSHGLVERCVIRGAGKLILCGCGDDPDEPDNAMVRDEILAERDKTVIFKHCILEQGGRRFPEVQGGMHVVLQRCLVQDWGMKTRFIDRSFGAWAHEDGHLTAQDCVFRQQSLKRGLLYWLADKIGHIGQAVNDDGLGALFSSKTYVAGTRRALTAQGTGSVWAINCWRSHPEMLVENCVSWMSENQADALIEELEQMRVDLKRKLGID